MTFNEWFCSLPEQRQAILREDKWMLARAAFDAGREHGHSDYAPVTAKGHATGLEIVPPNKELTGAAPTTESGGTT